ncbi:MAG: phospholipase D-like domain-containing protein, partial [Desulfobacterales bacterium]
VRNEQKAHQGAAQKKRRMRGSSKVSLHAKAFIFDRKHVFIGSLNLDPRAVHHNTEIGFVVDSMEIANQLSERFDHKIEKEAFQLELETDTDGNDKILWHGLNDGKQEVFSAEPHTTFWQRLASGFLGLLPIKSQL